MASAADKIRVFENVMARVGLDGDFLGEYFKGLSAINGMQTMTEMNPPMPPQPQMGASEPLSSQNGTMSSLGEQGLPTPSTGLNQPM